MNFDVQSLVLLRFPISGDKGQQRAEVLNKKDSILPYVLAGDRMTVLEEYANSNPPSHSDSLC
jgi:hypothetical protein